MKVVALEIAAALYIYSMINDHFSEAVGQRGLNTKRPTIVFFLGPTKPIQSYGKTKPTPTIQF